ncbi:MAG TPA: T9SS type A sorting domain-containing protein, partial [Flavobacteriales bacterium]|nr:T9SS type A sorting domain-containing protein [Flavobacteriales bacterium]
CDLTIDNTPMGGGNENFLGDGRSGQNEGLHMYPNPNRGDQLYLSVDAIEEGVSMVSVDIYDLFGERVSVRTIAVQSFDPNSGGFVNTVLDLEGALADGMYLVNVTAGPQRFIERLVIQK